MSRTLSSAAIASLLAQETSEAWLILLAISHADMTTIRVTSDGVDTVSNGDTYIAFPFEIMMPSEQSDQMAKVVLRIDNIDQTIIAEIRALTNEPTVSMSVVMASDPDTIEAGPFEFSLKGASYNQFTIEGNLSFEDILNEAFPADSFTPGNFPGIFN